MNEKYISSSALLYLVSSIQDGVKNKREEWLLNQVVEKIKFLPAANIAMLNWQKFPDNKPIAFKNYFVTLDVSREVVEAYYSEILNHWCYPHSFGTKVEGTVIAWADKPKGYSAD